MNPRLEQPINPSALAKLAERYKMKSMIRKVERFLVLALFLTLVGCGLRPTPPTAHPSSEPQVAETAEPRPQSQETPEVAQVPHKPKPEKSRKPFIVAHDEPEPTPSTEPSQPEEGIRSSVSTSTPVATRVSKPKPTPEQSEEPLPEPQLPSDAEVALTTAVPRIPISTTTDTIAPASPSIAKLARRITSGETDDKAKAHAIYRWLGENIAYDVKALYSGELSYKSPDTVVLRQKAVCAGYAELFHVMSREVGLKSAVITGRSRSDEQGLPPVLRDSPTNHAWNAVKIDGEWHLLDPTWGAGYVNEQKAFVKKPNDEWFMVPPNVFIYSHLPQAEEWQLLSKALDRTTFDSQPEVKPRFFTAGLELLEPKKQPLLVSGDVSFRVASRKGYLLSALVKSGDQDLPETSVLAQQRKDQSIVKVRFPKAGEYKVLLMARTPEDNTAHDVASFKVKSSIGVPEGFPKTYKSFADHHCQIIRGFQGQLKAGRKTSFIYEVPKAKELIIKNGSNYISMVKEGQKFGADFTPDRGELKVMAKFQTSDKRLPVLAEYQVR
jgi:transglutaminase-like putative cysteine protease